MADWNNLNGYTNLKECVRASTPIIEHCCRKIEANPYHTEEVNKAIHDIRERLHGG